MRTDLFSCELCDETRFKLKGLIAHVNKHHDHLVTISEDGEIAWIGMRPGEWGLYGGGYHEICSIRDQKCLTCNTVMVRQIHYNPRPDVWYRCPNGDAEGYNAIEVQLRTVKDVYMIVYRRRPESLKK